MAARRRRPRQRTTSGDSGSGPASELGFGCGPAVERGTQASPPAPYAAGESSISDSSSSLYAETDLNEALNLDSAGDVAQMASELATAAAEPDVQQVTGLTGTWKWNHMG